MIKTALAAALLCAMQSYAEAKAFKLGDQKPVAWVSIPNAWEPKKFDNGVEGTSPDRASYVAAEIIKATEMKEAGEEAGKFFVKNKIKVNSASKKEKETTMSGLPASDISWDATDEDGPTHVSLTIVKISDEKMLLLTYWGSEAGEKSNGADLATIAGSIKPIK